MAVRARITHLVSSSGQTLDLPSAGVTCIVGGNNVGKSQALRDINELLGTEDARSIVVRSLGFDRPIISEKEAEDFLCSVASKRVGAPEAEPQFTPVHGGQEFSVRGFMANYGGMATNAIGAARQFFVWYASAGALAGIAAGSIGNVGYGVAHHPLGRMYQYGPLEAEVSSLAKEAFGVPLTLDRISGDVRLRVGEVSTDVPPFNAPTPEYVEAVRDLPPLEHQGDGIKSFIGLAVAVIAGTAQILLIDEPEAFLHPAQARSLGRWLGAAAAAHDKQVILSTHDRDVLLGLLDSAPTTALNIVRLSREGDTNWFNQLPPDEVASVWGDPVLRYSNVLQGLFHDRVVICEGDSDCRFYGAVLDQLGIEEERRNETDGILLVPSGGKGRVASMAAALQQLGVTTHAILDFDVLRQRSQVIAIVHAVGGTWSDEMNERYVQVADAANGLQLWDSLKNLGLTALKQSDVHRACVSLLERLRSVGVHIVPVGELEDFDSTIDGTKASWVSGMLEAERHRTCTAARDLVAGILGPS